MIIYLQNKWRELAALICALLIVIALPVSGLLQLGQATGAGQITAANEAYLTDAAQEGLKEILLLGEVTAFLDVLQSTDFGIELIVSVDVRAGGVLSSLANAAEWALGAAAAATVTTHALQFINGIADQVSAYLLVGLLWSVIIWMVLRIVPAANAIRGVARGITETLAVLFLVSYLFVPYGINITGWLSQTAAGRLHVDTGTVVENLHGSTFKDGNLNTDLRFWTRSENVKSAYEQLTSELPDKTSALTRYTIEKFAHLLVVGILFPFTVLLVFGLMGRRLIKMAIAELDSSMKNTG